MLCYAMLFCVMLRYVVLCYVMLCCVMLICYAMYLVFPFQLKRDTSTCLSESLLKKLVEIEQVRKSDSATSGGRVAGFGACPVNRARAPHCDH